LTTPVSIGENRLKTGQHEIVTSELGTGVRFSSTEFRILRGQQQRIRISIGDTATAMHAATGVAAPQTGTRPPPKEFVVPAWAADAKGGYGIRLGDPLSPRSMVQRPDDLEGILSWTVETQDHRNSVDDVAFSPDGSKIATAGRDWTVRIWETTGGSLLKIVVCPGAVRRVAWSPNSNYLATAQADASAADSSICIWDIAQDATLIKRIQRAADRLAWSPDGTLLAFSEKTTHVWAFESGEVVPDLELQGSISSFPWTPSGSVLATAGSRGVELWDVVDGKQVGSFPSSNAFEATWSPSGRYLACLRRPVLRVSSTTRVPTGRGPGPSSASSPSRTPSSGKSKQIASYVEIWDATSGDRCNSFVVSDDAVPRALAWSPDESRIAVHAHGAISLWDAQTGSLDEMWDASSQHLRSDSAGDASCAIQWSASHHKAVVAIAGSALVWDIEQSDFRILSDSSYGQWEHVSVNPAAFHAQQGIVATNVLGPGPDRNIVWGLKSLKPLLVFDGNGESSDRWVLASSPDGKLLAASRPIPETLGDRPNVEIQFYSLPEAKQIGTVDVSVTPSRSGAPVWRTTWSPDGKQLAVSGTRTVVVVTPQKSLSVTSALRSSLTTPRVVPVCWSSDSRYLAWPDEARQESHVTVLDTTAEMSTQRLEVPLSKGIRAQSTGGRVAWSPSGPTLAYYHGTLTFTRGGSTDTSECLTLWESKEGSFELTAQSTQPTATSGRGQMSRATAMAFSPDAKTIAVLPAAADTMTIWNTADASRITEIQCGAAGQKEKELYWHPDGKRISFSSYDPAKIGVVDTQTGNVSNYTAPEESGMWLAQSGGTLAIGQRNQIVFCDADFTVSATQVIDRHEPTRALYVKADGTYRTSPDATEPRIVVLKGQTQTTLTPEEFQTRYGAE
jgi:WD40 repeat protein